MPKRKRGSITGDSERRRRNENQRRRRQIAANNRRNEAAVASAQNAEAAVASAQNADDAIRMAEEANRRRLADAANRQRIARLAETEDEAARRREADANRHRIARSVQNENEAARIREANADRHRTARSVETEDEAATRRDTDAIAHRIMRSEETEDEAARGRDANAITHRILRSEETEDEAARRREADANRHRIARSVQNEDEAARIREANANRHRTARFEETEDESARRREADAIGHRIMRSEGTEDEAARRRDTDAVTRRTTRSEETEDEAAKRREADANRCRIARSVRNEDEAARIREANANRHRTARSEETEDEAARRRETDAITHRISRSVETDDEATHRRIADANHHRNVREQEPMDVREDRLLADRVRRMENPMHNIARNSVTVNLEQHTCGLLNNLCEKCQALIFSDEFTVSTHCYTRCCQKGLIVESERDCPRDLRDLFTGDHALSGEFFKNIRSYNSLLSFASMGAQVDVPTGSGPYCFRIHGAIYHQTCHLRPPQPGQEKYAQCYILDSDEALRQRLNMSSNVQLNEQLLTLLDTMFRNVNPYAEAYKMMKEVEEQALQEERGATVDVRMYITGAVQSGQHERRYNVPNQNEVAIIFKGQDGDPPSNRDIVVHPRDGQLINISTLNSNLEPMTYVLFFPRGERGFQIQQGYSHLDFFAHRISVRQNLFNSILYGKKLFQQYLVDSYVKVEGDRLGFIRNNQQTLRVESYMGLADHVYRLAERSGVKPGVPVILPSSHIGSPRSMQQHYQDSMAIVRDFGKPDLFLTFTCNPKWPEITENLMNGQQAHDRPDLVARVFDIKKKALLKDLLTNHVLGISIADMHVIEFQKRGLPHMHLLMILSEEDKLHDADCVDSLVSAELPDEVIDPVLHGIVKSSMVHGPCGVLNPNSPCMIDGECSKGYPKNFVQDTKQNVGGYPLYRRRDDGKYVMIKNKKIDNRWVVPYNPYLLKKYNAHLNLEVCSSIKSVKYLFKYVYKGHDAANVVLEQSGNESLRWDEIRSYLNARYVSAPEAVWRLFRKNMQRKSHAVIRLAVHMENLQPVYFSEEGETEALQRAQRRHTMLTGWFELNRTVPEANQFLYTEIPYHYTWTKQCKWKVRDRGGHKVIPRMYSVSPKDVERFHLRLLLCHVRGAKSFEDLRTYENIVYATFKEACRARNLLQDDEEWKNCMREASAFQMPSQLRQLFAFICVFGSCTEPLSLWNEFREPMSEDFTRAHSLEDSLTLTLRCIQEHLIVHNVSLSSLGLPEPADGVNVIPSVPLYDVEFERQQGEDMKDKLNPEQRTVFDAVWSAIVNDNTTIPKSFCVNAFAGSGKTFLFQAILHAVRGTGRVAIPVAWTGIAAVLMDGGKTAHSAFKLPIPVLENSSCRIKHDSPEADNLRAAHLFVWDECTMTPHYALEAVDRLMRDLIGCNAPFGGKIFLLGGDWRQTLPVVKHGNRASAVETCLKSSHLWPHFLQFTLLRNMRLHESEQEFSEWLLKLGEGRLHNESGMEPDIVQIPPPCVARGSIVQEIFGSKENFNLTDLADKAILCPKNDETLKLNEIILSNIFPGHNYTFYSADEIVSDDAEEQDTYQLDFVHSLTPSGMPPHCLNLKKEAIVMLLRNLNASAGLCNGTRLLIKNIMRNFLDCEVVTGQKAGSRVFIPRTDLSPSDSDLPFTLKRRQFPVRLAFAMTINKSQGQTLSKVGIFLPQPVFSHGMLYVAFSRTKSVNNIRVSVTDSKRQGRLIHGSQKVFTENVVFREIFQS